MSLRIEGTIPAHKLELANTLDARIKALQEGADPKTILDGYGLRELELSGSLAEYISSLVRLRQSLLEPAIGE